MENTIKNSLADQKPSQKREEKFNIALFLSGRIVSLLGTYIYSFALSLYVLKVTGSGAFFSITILLGMLPRIVLGPFAGSLADRFDRKKMVVGLDILSGLVVIGLMVVSSIYGLQITSIYITTLLLGMINTFFDVSISASLPNLVKDESLMKINSYSQSANSLASIVAPVLGGIAYAILPINLFLLVNGISFIASAASEMFIDFNFNKPKEDSTTTPQKMTIKSIGTDIKEVLGFMKEQKALFTLLKYALLLNLLFNPVVAIALPYIINNVLMMTSSQFGLVEGAFSVGILAASIIIGKLPEKEKKLKPIVIGLSANGLMLVAIGLPALEFMKILNINILFAYYVIVAIILGVFLIIVNVPLNVSIQRMTPDKLRGRVMGVLGTLTGGIAPIGIIVSGLVIDRTPTYIIPFIGGIGVIISATLISTNKALKNF